MAPVTPGSNTTVGDLASSRLICFAGFTWTESKLTFQISDPAPPTFNCQPERYRRVRCIWLVAVWLILCEVKMVWASARLQGRKKVRKPRAPPPVRSLIAS